jgi:hypothetical protein
MRLKEPLPFLGKLILNNEFPSSGKPGYKPPSSLNKYNLFSEPIVTPISRLLFGNVTNSGGELTG